MTEATKQIVAATRHSIWKYFGAMFMEEKNGEQAVSFTRLLGVITFSVWIVLEVFEAFNMYDVKVPMELTVGMASFAGIKGMKDLGIALKGKP